MGMDQKKGKKGEKSAKTDRIEKKRHAERVAELRSLFKDVDESERILVSKLIVQVVDLEERMEELKKKPFITVHPRNPMLMRSTPAAKLYKETSAGYMNAIRILLSVLRQSGEEEQSELLKRLEEFA